jgi:hypothetical protein
MTRAIGLRRGTNPKGGGRPAFRSSSSGGARVASSLADADLGVRLPRSDTDERTKSRIAGSPRGNSAPRPESTPTLN